MQVLDEINFTPADSPCLAIAGGNLMRSVEVDNVLSSGRSMPIEEPISGRCSKDDAGGWEHLRCRPVRAGFSEFDFDVTEVRFAVLVCVKIVNAHGYVP